MKIQFPTLGLLALLTSCALTQMAQAQDSVFNWSDFSSLISDVQAGDSFTANNVDGSGVNFTFSFSQELDSRTNNPAYQQTILSPSNPGDLPSDYTGNGNREGLYTSNPLYLVGQSLWRDDKVILTITLSEPTVISNLIIGDIDRLTPADGASDINSFEDKVTITSSLSNTAVGVTLSSTSTTIDINGNVAESTSGTALESTSTDSQILVDTTGLVDTLTIVYQNGDADGGGLADSDDGWSNSHWITFGNDDQLLEFSAVPEPSSTALLGLGSICLLLRRKR